jgi:alkylation response protein AidB-like acyl-CoA dehydrogenase
VEVTTDYPARERALYPLIAAHAEQAERARRLPEAVLAALFEAGLFRLLLPRAFGGAEVDPVTFVRTIEAVAQADASTAWVLCQVSGSSMISAYLKPAVVREIFGGDPRAILAWGAGPAGRAVVADGGYRVSGTWEFASGGRHATWLGAHCPVHEPDGTPRLRDGAVPEVRTMLFPASRATLHDVWHVIGLRATGSDAYAVDSLFVPAAHSAARDEPGERREPGPLYRFPIGNLFAAGFAGVALGLARSLLDALLALARDKTPRGTAQPLAARAVVQSQLAQAEARWGAARAFLLSSLDEIWRDAGRDSRLALGQRVRIRLAATHALHEAREAAGWAYHTAGAGAIFEGSAFERRFRDMHAVSQQVQGRHAHYETVGRFLLGLDPASPFV